MKKKIIQRNKAWLGALISGVGNIAGSLINNYQQKKQQEQQLKLQKEEEERQRVQGLNTTAVQQAGAMTNALANQNYVDEYNKKVMLKNGGLLAHNKLAKPLFSQGNRIGSKGNTSSLYGVADAVYQQLIPNVVRGGNAVNIGNGFYYMQGRKHKDGGIDLGTNPRKGIEVEDGEVMKVTNKGAKVYSAERFLNGESPAEKVLKGENADNVFRQQEKYKDRKGIKNDGTKRAKGGRINNMKYCKYKNGGEIPPYGIKQNNNIKGITKDNKNVVDKTIDIINDKIESENREIYNWINNWYSGRRKQLEENRYSGNGGKFAKYDKGTVHTRRDKNWDKFNLDMEEENRRKQQYNAIQNTKDKRLDNDNKYNKYSYYGRYEPKDNSIYINNDNDVYKNRPAYMTKKGTRVHETTHSKQTIPSNNKDYKTKGLVDNQLRKIRRIRYENGKDYNGKQSLLKNDVNERLYYSKPHEIEARLMQYRYDMGLKPEQIIDKKYINSHRQQLKDYHLDEFFDDDGLIRLFNEVASNNNKVNTNIRSKRTV